MDSRDVELTANVPSGLNSGHGGRKEVGTPFEKDLWSRWHRFENFPDELKKQRIRVRGGLGCDVLGAPCRRAANSIQPVHGRRLKR